jgi:hypothetical protein
MAEDERGQRAGECLKSDMKVLGKRLAKLEERCGLGPEPRTPACARLSSETVR